MWRFIFAPEFGFYTMEFGSSAIVMLATRFLQYQLPVYYYSYPTAYSP